MIHPGEERVQRRAGVRMEPWGSAAVEGRIPQPAADMLYEQRMVIVAAAQQGQVWASVLTGPPGFGEVAGTSLIRFATEIPECDPLAGIAVEPAEVGLLALDMASRRRLRINGNSLHSPSGGIMLHTAQVYANCPKYIQTRDFAGDRSQQDVSAVHGKVLTPAHQGWIAGADTFFIGTAVTGLGADASHRGGNPGFVKVEGNRLSWPDYAGNLMYMTLGNLDVDPRAGLLFIDWDKGHTLHLSGRASVDWDPGRASRFSGAQRVIDFNVDDVIEIKNRIEWSWTLRSYSRFNPS